MPKRKKGGRDDKPGYVGDATSAATQAAGVDTPASHLSACRVATVTLAAYPPTMDEQSLNAGILGLATHKTCGRQYHYRLRWALTPPFHPYRPRMAGGHFLSRGSAITDSFPLESMALCVARTFLPALVRGRATGCPARKFHAKLQIIRQIQNFIANLSPRHS